MIYRITATCNYRTDEMDIPVYNAHGKVELIRRLNQLLDETPMASSYCITITKYPETELLSSQR
jgi:hypothetical protein